MTNLLYWGVTLAWFLYEVGVALRRRAVGATRVAGGAAWPLWVGIGLGIGLASASQLVPSPMLPGAYEATYLVGAALVAAGWGLRVWAIRTLGRHFTVNVEIQADHEVVTTGPYAWVRHPSYTGLLVAFAGVGVGMGTWLAVALVVAPVALGLAWRIRVEEAALADSLGPAYTAYCAGRKRLVPGVY